MQTSSPIDLRERIKACFDELGLAPDAPLVAAVSGGPDSMALLDVLASEPTWHKRLSVGHVDHGLRSESPAEALFVAEQCRIRATPFATTRLDIAPMDGRNLAARLRDARYAYLRSLVPPGGYLLTAHHADDQAVTMLMRLIEGAALPGLRGMRMQRDEIIRPFLNTERRHLLAWLAANQVPFCQDPSNEYVEKYRNRVRKEIWPLVVRERPGAAETLARSAQRLEEDDDALTEWARRLTKNIVWGENWAEIPREAADAPPAVLRRLLALAITSRWEAAPPNGNQWGTVLAAMRHGTRANLPGRITVEKYREGLLLLRAAPLPPVAPLDIAQPGDYVLPMGTLRALAVARKVVGRRLEPGDRFANGKRVVEVLTARGLPKHRRAGYPVVIDTNSGRVLSAPSESPEKIEGVGEFAFVPHGAQSFTAPQIVMGLKGAL